MTVIKAEIDKLKAGTTDGTSSAYAPSVLKHLGEIQTVVKLQQGLQQVRSFFQFASISTAQN